MYDRILVPLDGSKLAEVALDHASELARRFKSRLVVLRVVSPVEPGSSLGAALLDSEGEEPPVRIDLGQSDTEVKVAAEYLETLRGNLEADGISTTARVLEGEAVAAILQEAEAAGVSLIVMSTHGHGGFKHAEVGSVAGKVLQGSRVPLHIVPYR